jgi:hypothetical protein
MNPAILNYLQSQQGQSQGEGQSSPMQQNQGQQAPYNPFDSGIRSAIESAKQSLGMTEKQQDKALRRSMLTFADNIAQQPKQRGFFANFGSAARALSPAIATHDQAEDEALTQNNAMANQILAYRNAEETKQAQAEQQAWQRQHAESQLGETKRSHNLLDRFRRDSLESKNQSKGGKENNLDKVLDQAESLINKSDTSTHRGRGKRILNKFVPGGEMPLTKEQAEINAMGDVLRGQLFNKWGYRNQAEFERVPSISADNPREVNLAIIKQLKGLLSKSGQMPEQEITSSGASSESTNSQEVLMRDPETGEQEPIPANRVQEALNDGLVIVE